MECDCVCFDDGRNGICGAIRAKSLETWNRIQIAWKYSVAGAKTLSRTMKTDK